MTPMGPSSDGNTALPAALNYVATTVVSKKGTRAIGTYVSARKADGSPNPVVAAVMQGKKKASAGEELQGTAYASCPTCRISDHCSYIILSSWF